MERQLPPLKAEKFFYSITASACPNKSPGTFPPTEPASPGANLVRARLGGGARFHPCLRVGLGSNLLQRVPARGVARKIQGRDTPFSDQR